MLLKGVATQCDMKQPIIVSKDKNDNRKHVAYNRKASNVFQYKIDGDVIKTTDICKCDYLLENETSKTLYFIELKGSDLIHATKQIESTINYFKKQKNINDFMKGYTIKVRIVCHSKSHQMYSTEVKKFIQNYKKSYIIQNYIIEENI